MLNYNVKQFTGAKYQNLKVIVFLLYIVSTLIIHTRFIAEQYKIKQWCLLGVMLYFAIFFALFFCIWFSRLQNSSIPIFLLNSLIVIL